MFQIPTERDAAAGLYALTPSDQVAMLELEIALPYLWWLTVFGKPYYDMFGADRLLSAPALTERLAPETVALQLTGSADDQVTAWEKIHRARIAVAAHLGRDAFFNSSVGRHAQFRTPRFPRRREV